MGPLKIDWNLVAVWVQTIANTVVLFMIYLQMRQVQAQMTQSDEQERFSRSWEFVRLYRDELRTEEVQLDQYREGFDPLTEPLDSPAFLTYADHFFAPRMHLFILLNQLIQHQQVDERILFGYLEDEFNRFAEIGIRKFGSDNFRNQQCARINILLTLWGSQIKASRMLYGGTNIMPTGDTMVSAGESTAPTR
jgi:hypothetical protein